MKEINTYLQSATNEGLGLEVVPELNEKAFEYMERSDRVDLWKQRFNTALGIDKPRWDAVQVFHPERFGSFETRTIELIDENGELTGAEEITVFLPSETEEMHVHEYRSKHPKNISIQDVPTGNGSHIPEYFTDVADIVTDAVQKAQLQGFDIETDEVQEALINLGVGAVIRLEKVLGDDRMDVEHRIEQFVLIALQRIQLEITGRHSRDFDAVRMFQKELGRARKGRDKIIETTDRSFMELNNTNRWEDITMTLAEVKLGEKNFEDFEKVRQAVQLATKYHAGQTHLGLSEYPVHLFRVMVRIMEDDTINNDSHVLRDTLILGATHDLLEDTQISPEELAEVIGKDLTDGVVALSKWINAHGAPTVWDPEVYFGNLAAQDKKIRDVKGYDRVDNCAASKKKVDTEIEDKKDMIKLQEEYYLETGRYFPDLIADNPRLIEQLGSFFTLNGANESIHFLSKDSKISN